MKTKAKISIDISTTVTVKKVISISTNTIVDLLREKGIIEQGLPYSSINISMAPQDGGDVISSSDEILKIEIETKKEGL